MLPLYLLYRLVAQAVQILVAVAVAVIQVALLMLEVLEVQELLFYPLQLLAIQVQLQVHQQ